jgi:hypothetical protein
MDCVITRLFERFARGERDCPKCGRSRGVVIGGRKSKDGSAFLVSDAGTEKHDGHNYGHSHKNEGPAISD